MNERRIFIALGSNLGDRQAFLDEAVVRISGIADVTVVARSSWLNTEAVTGDPQPLFLNGVIEIRTGFSAAELIRELEAIEQQMGRRSKRDEAPRTIDLDLLLMGEEIVSSDEVEVPHPRMHERDFVLIPMREIASEVIHPVMQKTIGELYEMVVWGVYGRSYA